MKVVKVLTLIGIPISIFIYFSSEEIIYLVLGERWGEVAPILKILSISIWVQMISSSVGAIFQATGRTDLLFKLGLASASVLIAAIMMGTLYFKSLSITAYALVASFLISFVLIFFVLMRYIFHKPVIDFFRVIASHFDSAFALIAALWFNTHYANFQIVDFKSALVSLFIKAAVSIIIFAIFNFRLIKRYLPGKPQLT
jgi:PST family polysaccharide transporter